MAKVLWAKHFFSCHILRALAGKSLYFFMVIFSCSKVELDNYCQDATTVANVGKAALWASVSFWKVAQQDPCLSYDDT